MRKVLVTGGTGFLGRHLVKALKARGDEVEAPIHIAWDLHYYHSLVCVKDLKFDLIFHLAVDTSAGNYCLTHKADQWVSNQIINTNILRFWRDKQPQAKMITMGTSCSYDMTSSMKEEDYLKGDPDKDLRVYAMTKRMLLEGLRACESQHDMKWLYLIPSTLYGPDYKSNEHFVFEMVRKIMKSKETGEKIQLWGSGNQERELLHVKDFIRDMLNVIGREEENMVVNLGCGRLYKLKTIAEMLCSIAAVPVERIEWDTSKYVGEPRKELNTDIATMLLGNLVHTDLAMGLTELIEDYK